MAEKKINIVKGSHKKGMSLKAGIAAAVIGVAALFGGCKDVNSGSPCTCKEKDHATACACGGDNCACTVKANPKIYTLTGAKSFTVEDKTWEVTPHILEVFQTGLGYSGGYTNLSTRDIKLIVVDEVISAGIEQGADNKTMKASINFLLTESDANILIALNDALAALNIARINESNNIRHINAQPVITPRAQVAYA